MLTFVMVMGTSRINKINLCVQILVNKKCLMEM